MKQNTASQRIAAEIRTRIRSGALKNGDLAPSARQIVREHQVAIATATKVLAILKREGLVRTQPGVGTVVRGVERGLELSRERIVDAAISIADDEGTAALSMRTLARELGVATMSLYRHVGSKEGLLVLMADRAFAEVPIPPREKKGWRARVAELCALQWQGYKRHTWLAEQVSMTRPEVMKNGMRHTEAMAEALDGVGLDDVTLMRSAVTVIAYVRGMAVALEAELVAEVDTGQTSEEWMADREADYLTELGAFPILTRMVKVNVPMDIDSLFETGLDLILDGLARKIDMAAPEARSRPRGHRARARGGVGER